MRLTLPPRGRRAQRTLAVSAAPALVLGLALTAPAHSATASPAPTPSASPDHDRPVYLSHPLDNRASARTTTGTYWTPERMAHAVPADRLTRDAITHASPGDRMPATTAARPAAPAPAGGAAKTHKSQTIGKVFFTTEGGVDMVCSGSAVNSKAKNMVMTAGHCVNGGKGKSWYHRWIFVPGYGPGNRTPNGLYRAKRLISLAGWVKHSNLNDDVGIALVKPVRGTKKKLVKNVGGYGVQFGRSGHRKLAAIGYSQVNYKGDKQKNCRKWTHRRKHDKFQLVMRCHVLTGGASGGPWVKGKAIKGQGLVNGVNSTNNDLHHPTKIRTPYFGRDVFRMYNAFRK